MSWWKIYQFIIVFLLEIYQFFFLVFKNEPDREILAWNLLLNWYPEDGCSEVIVSNLFSMCSDESLFDFYFRYSIKFCRPSSCILKNDHIFLVKASFRWLMNQSRSCVVCRDIFLSTDAVILLFVWLFITYLSKYRQFFG